MWLGPRAEREAAVPRPWGTGAHQLKQSRVSPSFCSPNLTVPLTLLNYDFSSVSGNSDGRISRSEKGHLPPFSGGNSKAPLGQVPGARVPCPFCPFPCRRPMTECCRATPARTGQVCAARAQGAGQPAGPEPQEAGGTWRGKPLRPGAAQHRTHSSA